MSLEKLNELVKINLEEFAQFLSKAKLDDYYGLKFRILTIEIIKKNFDNTAAKQLADPSADENYKLTTALFEERLNTAHAMVKDFDEIRESEDEGAAGGPSTSSVADFERVSYRRAERIQEEEEACALPGVYDVSNDFDEYAAAIAEMSEPTDCDVAQQLERIRLRSSATSDEASCASASSK